MPAGISLAETTIFVPKEKLKPVIRDFRKAGFETLPHPFSATHHNLKDGSTTFGLMVDVLGPHSPLVLTLARTFTAYGLKELNNPVFISPFIQSE